MAVLVWDAAGQRFYQTGLDRGVLYLPSGEAYPWNGLVSVNEGTARELKPYYIDGVKYLDHKGLGSYAAKVTAFTYPDVMDELVGVSEYAPGVFVHDQPSPRFFHFSYRTLIGNDLEGVDHGYKIHVIYNAVAVLSDTTQGTIGDSVSADPFEWTLLATPVQGVPGIRPTAHISVDSRKLSSLKLETLEGRLYGTSGAPPNLPNLATLLGLID